MPFMDYDGDGLDDETGLTPEDYDSREAWRRVFSDSGDGAGDSSPGAGTPGTDGRRPRHGYASEQQQRHYEMAREASEQQRRAAARDSASDRRSEAENYAGSESRTNDLDSGRGGRYGDPDREYEEEYDRSMSGGPGGGEGGGTSDFDEASADIPLWGWISGATARSDAERAAIEAENARRTWRGLDRWMPSADDLAVEYSEEGEIAGPERSELAGAQADRASIEAQRAALGAVEDVWRSGGMTAADRARQQQAYEQAGMAARAQREADTSALQARGIGGGGAQVASMLSGQQGAAQSRSAADAQMLIEAQRRALQAMGMSGQMAGQMRGQSFEEEATRRGAADDFNRYNTDYLRGREERNTRYRHQTGESRSRARQQQYENRERQAAGLTSQWQAAASGRRADQAREDESNQAAAGALGTLLENL